MYVGTLRFGKERELDPSEAAKAVRAVLEALRNNGQVCDSEWPIANEAETLAATVMLPAEDALAAGHNSQNVDQALDRLAPAGLSAPSCSAVPDLVGLSPCTCAHRKSLILYTDYLSLESPLRCGDCFDPIPLYLVPPEANGEHNGVLVWRSTYQCCDRLQMNCGPLERSAEKELSRLDSSLSELGLALCREIAAAMGMPVYYYLYRYSGRSLRAEKERRCPGCDGEWLLPEPWRFVDFRCDRCRLLSSIAFSVPRS